MTPRARSDRITYVGHATVLLELGGVRLLTDPVLRARVGALRRHGSRPAPAVTEGVDAVLISHLHHDHLDLPSLCRLGRDVPLLVPDGAGTFLRRKGFAQVTELSPDQSTHVGGLEITAVPAVHEGRRWPRGPHAAAIGFHVAGLRRLYFAGDTGPFDRMSNLSAGLDLALLPIWGWGRKLGPGHLDPRQAAEAAALLRPRIAVPIHWGTFLPVGLGRRWRELLEWPGREFADQMASLAPAVEARVLAPGESLALESPSP
jgi:L-ascorbate metabolism protein UlaG (beta-lactamase superfamily)